MDVEPHHSLGKALMKAAPTTDIGLSVAPGLMPQRQNMDSYQRAVGAGTIVQRGKAAEAMRRREMMAKKIDQQKPEEQTAKLPVKHSAIVDMMIALAGKEEHKRQEQSMVHQEQIIKHQQMKESARMARHFAMQKAMEKK